MPVSIQLKKLLVVALIGASLGACGGAEQRLSKYMQEGQSKFDQGDYEKARIGFKNALQINPKDQNAQFKYALTLEKLQDWRNAAGLFQKLIDDHPEFDEARVHLGQLLLLAKETGLAEKQADAILQHNPNSVAGLTLKSGVMALQGKVAEGITQIEKALAIKADDVDALIMASTLNRSAGKLDTAEALLQQGLKHHPDKTDFLLLAADLYQSQKRTAEARASIEKAIALEPNQFSHRARLAQLYASINDVEQVEAILSKAIKDFPDDAKIVSVYVDYELKVGRKEAALQLLDKAIGDHPTEYEYSFKKADLLLADNKVEDAKKLLMAISEKEETQPAGLTAKTKLARIALQGNQSGEAAELLTKVLSENPSAADALMLRAVMEISEKRFADAIPDLRTVLRDQPQNIEANKLMIAAYLQSDQSGLALEQLEKALKLAPADISLLSQSADLYAEKRQFDKAELSLQHVIGLAPLSVPAYLQLAKMQLAQSKSDAAQTSLEKVLKMQPDHLEASLLKAKLLQNDGNAKDAVTLLKHLREKEPHNELVLRATVSLLVQAEGKNAATDYVNEIIKHDQQFAAAYAVRAEIRFNEKNLVDAESDLRAAIKADPIYLSAYLNLANLLSAQQKNSEAISLLKQGLTKQSDSMPLLSALAAEYEKANKIDEAISVYDQLVALSKQSPAAMNNLAMLLVSYKTDEASLEKAGRLVEPLKDSDNALFLDTVGWVYYKKGDNEKAQQYLARAIDKKSDIAVMHYHLAMTKLKIADKTGAKQELEKALSSGQAFPGVNDAKEALKQLSEG